MAKNPALRIFKSAEKKDKIMSSAGRREAVAESAYVTDAEIRVGVIKSKAKPKAKSA